MAVENKLCITVIFLARAPPFFRVDFQLPMFDYQRVVKIFGNSTFNLILHPYLLIIHIYYQSYSTSIFIPCSGWSSGDPETFRARTHGRGCAEYNCQHGQVGCQNGRPGRVFGCPNMAGWWMGWLKEKSRGNRRFFHEIWDLPVFFP